MVSINYATREVCCKIVYYGPGLSGKTTNLQVVHEKVPQNTRGKLISLATEADRTLYFDFLPINIGSINGFAAKFQLYTVPGQVYYNATRRLVLRGVDGVVFVADSQEDKHDDNLESLSNLKENLEEYGYNVTELPIVIQYNKADLPTALSQEALDAKLNIYNWPSYTAAAVDGVGVFDTLKAIMKLVLEKAKKGGTGSRSTASATRQPAASSAASSAMSTASAASTPTATQEEVVSDSKTQPTLATSPAIELSPASDTQPNDTQPNDTQSVGAAVSVATARQPSSGVSSPKGGLFGAPRSASGRTRHTAKIGTGSVSSTEESVGSRPADTGKIEVEAHQEAAHQSGSLPRSGVGSIENQPNKQGFESSASMMGHDPLEQAPPQPKQKKPGFFRRLFGRK